MSSRVQIIPKSGLLRGGPSYFALARVIRALATTLELNGESVQVEEGVGNAWGLDEKKSFAKARHGPSS
jgi:hypothetical protein